MRGENLSEELKTNIVFEHEKRGLGALRIANKFNIDQSTVTCFLQRFRGELNDEVAKDFKTSGFQKVEMPDEELQSTEEKIAFYKSEAEKYKMLAKDLEKKLGFLRNERRAFEAREINNVVKNHKVTKIDGHWKMSRDEFMDFYSEFGAM